MLYLGMISGNNININNQSNVRNTSSIHAGVNKNIMNNQQSLPSYYMYTNNPYQPSEPERDFHNLVSYCATNPDFSRADFAESFLIFDSEIDENDCDIKTYMFTTLIEALNKTQIPSQKSLFFETLDNVLAQYGDDLSSVIDFYLSSDILSQNIKDYLKHATQIN